MSIPRIKLQKKPTNYQDWPWKDSRLEDGLEITELDDLDDLTKTIAHKLIASTLERQEAFVLWGDHELYILDEAEIWLKARPVKPQPKWSPETIFHHRNASWWSTQIRFNWRLKLASWPYEWSTNEESWLTAWQFKGSGSEFSDVWGELMHKETNCYRENDLQNFPRPVLNPDFYKYSGKEIDLPEARKTEMNLSDVLKKRTSKILSQNELTIQNLSDVLSIAFRPISENPFKASYSAAGGIYETHIFIEARNVIGLEPGFYAYHPLKHKFFLIGKGRKAPGSSTLLFISECAELSAKYQNLTYRLALMNTGVIYHHLSLIVSALNLQGHAWGATSEPEWKRLLGNYWKPTWKILGSYGIEGSHE